MTVHIDGHAHEGPNDNPAAWAANGLDDPGTRLASLLGTAGVRTLTGAEMGYGLDLISKLRAEGRMEAAS